MNTTLRHGEIESYRRNGFVLHPELLNLSEVKELTSAVLEAIGTLGTLSTNYR